MVIDIEKLRTETVEIINVNPIEITFTRHERSIDDYGNVSETESETEPQRVRIAELSHSETENLMQQGLLKNHYVNITAEHNADIKNGDKFNFLGDRYEVEFIRKITVGGYEAENCYKMSGKAKELKEVAE